MKKFLAITIAFFFFVCTADAVNISQQNGGASFDDILTALGIASEATHFGEFTGTTINDNQTAKAAIQALETAVEGKAAASADTFANRPATCTAGKQFFTATDTHCAYSCEAGNVWIEIGCTGADGSFQLTITNNTAISPTASANQLYPEANVWKAVQNGTESSVCIGPTAGQVTFAGPTQARTVTLPDAAITVARSDAGQTFTGVQAFTSPTFTTKIVAVSNADIGSATEEWGDVYLKDGAVIKGQNDQSNTITSAATGWTFAKPITVADVTNDNYIKITNNAGGRAPTASVYEIYPDAGLWKLNENGTEYTVQKAGACTALASDGVATALTVASTNCYTLTVDDNEDQTITFSGAGYAGQEITIIFTTAGAGDEVITFHATLVSSTGTLTLGTDAGKFYTVKFISDGSHWYEVSRTAVQT